MNFDSNVLVTAVATVAAGAFSGLFAYLASRNSTKVAAMRDRLRELRAAHLGALKQIEAYHALEGIYAAELEFVGKGGSLPIKTEFRSRVETMGYTRPTMTTRDASLAIEGLQSSAV